MLLNLARFISSLQTTGVKYRVLMFMILEVCFRAGKLQTLKRDN